MSKFSSYYKDVLLAAQKNSTCKRLNVAAVIVKDGRILSTGWNGSLPGREHCCDHFSDLDSIQPWFYETHGKFSLENESHAEVSAIAFAAKEGIKIDGCEMAVTHTPCLPCAKTIIMSGITKIYYLEKYDRDPAGYDCLVKSGIIMEQI